MSALRDFLENLKEKLKAAWAEQQESELYTSTKEKFDALPPIAQKGIIAGVFFLFVLMVLWWPLSNFLDSSDFNSKFEDRRQSLKELLRIERDAASLPSVPAAPPPSSQKAQFDGKLVAAGVKPEQITEQMDLPPQNVNGANQQGFGYKINHLTIRQALDISYELEHTDPTFKLASLELLAEPQDPHYYMTSIKVVSFAPKLADLGPPGKGIIDAIKGRGKHTDEEGKTPAGKEDVDVK